MPVPGGWPGGAAATPGQWCGSVAPPALCRRDSDRCGALAHRGEAFPIRTPARRKALSEVELHFQFGFWETAWGSPTAAVKTAPAAARQHTASSSPRRGAPGSSPSPGGPDQGPRNACPGASHPAGSGNARPVIAASLQPRSPLLYFGQLPPPAKSRAMNTPCSWMATDTFPPSALCLVRKARKQNTNNLSHESNFVRDTTTWQQRSVLQALSRSFILHSGNRSVNPCTSFPAPY